MKQIAFLLPLILLLSSTRAIEVGWDHQDDSDYQDDVDNQDEFIVGGSGVDLQTSSDSAIRLTNGIFDLYRLLSSDNQKLNQIVSNVKQTVGKDTYAVNHVFKHIKNGNYYLELDTDKYNFAVTFVRMPNTKHIHDNDSDRPSTTIPPSTSKPTEPSKTTTPPSTTKPGEPFRTTPPSTAKPGEPSRTTPPSTSKPTEPSKTTPPSTTKPGEPSRTTPPSTTKPGEPSKTTPPPSTAKPGEPSKTTPPPSTAKPGEPSRTTPPSTTKPGEPSKTTPPPSTTKPGEPSKTTPPPSTAKPVNTTQIQQEAEKLRRLEDKRFRQILGQWHLAGVKTGEWFDDVDYKACQVITIYTHGNNYYLKTLNNAGNNTYKMTDEHIESVDKKNNVFKLNNNVYRYKTVLLQGKNYKVKVLQLSNLNNSTDVSFYTENSVERSFMSKVFADHYADLKLFTVEQECD